MEENRHQLAAYIKQQLQSGQTAPNIAAQLRTANWPEEEIQQGFSAVQAEMFAGHGQTPPPVTASSQAQMAVPVEPDNSPSTHRSTKNRASLNPFNHFVRGFKNFIKTNFLATAASVALSIVVAIPLAIGFAYSMVWMLFSSIGGISSAMLGPLAVLLILFLVGIFLQSYFGQVFTRLVLTGSRKQKVSLKDALTFALHRYKLTVRTFLMVGGLIILAAVPLILLTFLSPILGLLYGIVYVLGIIIASLRLVYIMLIIVDDQKPADPMAVIKASSALWKRSGGAVVLYLIITAIIATLLNNLSDHLSQSGGISSFGVGIFGFILTVIITTIVWSFLFGGLTDIYNEITGSEPGPQPK